MENVEILKALGAFSRWIFSGFKGSFMNFYDDKNDRLNFVIGIVFLVVVFTIILPAVFFILNS